jgi:hypothetical protein
MRTKLLNELQEKQDYINRPKGRFSDCLLGECGRTGGHVREMIISIGASLWVGVYLQIEFYRGQEKLMRRFC